MNKQIYYTGIGSRDIPHDVEETFIYLGIYFARKGYVLRSGGADGADSAFETGCDVEYGRKEIYLPWRGFNDNHSPLFNISKDAMLIAEHFHPSWSRLSNGVKKLMARNSYQVLGQALNEKSDFMICYTKNGSGQGGTGQAIRIAQHHNIPIIDFGNAEAKEQLNQLIRSLNKERN